MLVSCSHIIYLSVTSEFRRSSEAELESPTSPTEDKENRFSWHRSKSLNVLTDDGEVEVFSQQDVQVANKVVKTCCKYW